MCQTYPIIPTNIHSVTNDSLTNFQNVTKIEVVFDSFKIKNNVNQISKTLNKGAGLYIKE